MARGLLVVALVAAAAVAVVAADGWFGAGAAPGMTSFVSIGDWGQVNADQSAVASAMHTAVVALNASFIVSTGDNFYPAGVASKTDPQWQTTFENVYARDVTWKVTLGNHDHMPANGGQAEIDYSLQVDGRFYLPSHYYTETYGLANGQTVQIVYLDTVLLCPLCTLATLTEYVRDGEYTQPELDVYHAALPHWQTVADAEWGWLNATLAASTADWLLTAGHYPIYSGGEHGSQLLLIAELEPLLQRAGVDAHINGHDHTMQHLTHDGMQFFVTGGGAKKGKYHARPQSVWGEVVNGFMSHTFPADARDQMRTDVYDQTGKVIYSATQQRRVKPHETRAHP